MKLGAKGEALIKNFETLQLTSYPDQGGVWTIGYGHTGPDVRAGQSCTPEQAEAWFLADTGGACQAVTQLVDVAIVQDQFDALVSFTFNVGAFAFKWSTLLKLLNGGDTAGAADQFLVWNKVNNQVSAGLVKRRAAERALFLGLG